MKPRVFSRLAGAALFTMLLTAAGPVFSQQSLDISSETVSGLMPTTATVSMTNTAPVEGFVLAVGYDTTAISVVSFDTTGATNAAGAEFVESEIFDATGGATLGVVLDTEAPFDGQTIPVGSGQAIATLSVMPDMVVGVATPVALNFVDGSFNSPTLDNIIVQGGLSFGAGDIDLNAGTITLEVPPPDDITIEDVSIPAGGEACARILLNNSSGPVQGFVLAIGHDANLNLEAINLNGTVTAAVGAEFVVPDLQATGGTLGVVLDFDPPFDGQTIPVGGANHIANFCYSCDNHPTDPDPATAHPLTFVDGVFGSPALDNVIVVAGLSLNPSLNNGTAFCEPQPLENTEFSCGVMDENGNIVDPTGNAGDTVQMCFYYSDPDDNLAGFQMAICFDCNLEFQEGTFTIEDTILEAVGAEFVNHHVDNDPNDGDGCELVIGILLDAGPPFDGQTVPPSATPLEVGCIDVLIEPTAPCNTCLPVEFCNGINGAGSVLIENIVVNDVASVQGFTMNPCNICVEAEREFIRGDCNTDEKVDLADAAAVLASQFGSFSPLCDDACDVNDDGKVNLADSVYLLNYQFMSGAEPPMPFPDEGTDPTDDLLGCDGGIDPCP